MKYDIRTFHYEDSLSEIKYPIRILVKNNVYMYCIQDVADVFGIADIKRLKNRIYRHKGVEKYSFRYQKENLTFLNDLGFCELIFTTTSLKKDDFNYWVFKELFPKIKNIENDSIRPRKKG